MSFADIDRNVLGKEFDRASYGPVTAEEILAYARRLGETDPLYLDPEAAAAGPHAGLVAHPSFVIKLRGGKMVPKVVAEQMGLGGFDAGKDIELGAPIRPGDAITIQSEVHDLYEKTGRTGRMYFIVIRSTLTNQRGELVATVDQKMMQRGRRSKARHEKKSE